MERSPLTFYQEIMLRKCLDTFEYPVDYICNELDGIMGQCLHQEELLEKVIAGGSLAYNGLISILQSYPDPKLYMGLQNHNIKEYYRWVWLLCGDVISRGTILHPTALSARIQANYKLPSYDTYDGRGAPTAKLGIESICKCYKDLPPGATLSRKPCKCFDEWKPCGCMVVGQMPLKPTKHCVLLPELIDNQDDWYIDQSDEAMVT